MPPQQAAKVSDPSITIMSTTQTTERKSITLDVSQHPYLRSRKSSVFVIDDAVLKALQTEEGDMRSSKAYKVKEVLQVGTVEQLMRDRDGRYKLNALCRVEIMLDVANVIHHLHENGKSHGFVTAHNVGLTSDLTPKLMVNEEKKSSKEGDVFDFGILMIELLTGSLQNDQSEGRKFGDLVERYITQGKILEDDLDPYVRENWTFNIVSDLISLALSCIQAERDQRPSTAKLVETLTLIASRMSVVTNYDYF